MKTIFSDFDGTITTEKGELLPSTINQIYKLSKLYDIIIVTGRPVAWGELILSCFPIKAVIAENGYCCITPTKKYYPFGEAKNQQKIIIGYFGTLDSDSRGLEYLIDFCTKNNSKVSLLIAGQGRLHDAFEKKSSEDIYYVGSFSQNDLPVLYNCVDFTWNYIKIALRWYEIV